MIHDYDDEYDPWAGLGAPQSRLTVDVPKSVLQKSTRLLDYDDPFAGLGKAHDDADDEATFRKSAPRSRFQAGDRIWMTDHIGRRACVLDEIESSAGGKYFVKASYAGGRMSAVMKASELVAA